MGYITLEGRILYLPLHLVRREATARSVSGTGLQELAASIRQLGVLQPLTVRRNGEFFQVVSGNRRLLAARIAGLGEVPCILLDVDAADAELVGLTENLQREDLDYFEEALCLRRYLDRSGLTQAQAAKKLGRSQSAIANKLRLLKLTPPVRQLLSEHALSERHARELLRVPTETEQLVVLRELIARHLSVAQTERYIDAYLQNSATQGPARLRRRDARLLLERIHRDAELLQQSGVDAAVQESRQPDGILLTLHIPQSV